VRSTVTHNDIQPPLGFLRIYQIAFLDHFTIIPDHFCNVYGVLFTLIGTIMVYLASIFVLASKFHQPGATGELVPGHRVHPDFSTGDVPGDFWSMLFPPINFGRGR
jgi:hypothetical protein